MADDPDNSLPFSPEKKTFFHQFVGVFLYYAVVVNLTILTALNSIVESQANPTYKTLAHWNQLLNHLSWHPQAAIEYKASNMQLQLHGDAAYLVAAKACILIAGYFFLSESPDDPLQMKLMHNVVVHVECRLLKHVVANS